MTRFTFADRELSNVKLHCVFLVHVDDIKVILGLKAFLPDAL